MTWVSNSVHLNCEQAELIEPNLGSLLGFGWAECGKTLVLLLMRFDEMYTDI